MYEFAEHFKVWNVEQSGGLKYVMEYDQFWGWMEFSRLSGFLQKEDWRSSQLLSKLHNVNTTKEAHLTAPKDFMPLPLDEVIAREIEEEERIEREANQAEDIDERDASIHNFKSYVENLKATHKPVKETIKG